MCCILCLGTWLVWVLGGWVYVRSARLGMGVVFGWFCDLWMWGFRGLWWVLWVASLVVGLVGRGLPGD